VAFDVYRAAGGGYVERVVLMFLATVVFWVKVAEHQVRLMHADGILWSLREWMSLFRFLFISPGLTTSLVRNYVAYYKPGFHPWQHDNRALLEAWKATLPEMPVANAPS
jgi:predicted metal-dependent hydrolase